MAEGARRHQGDPSGMGVASALPQDRGGAKEGDTVALAMAVLNQSKKVLKEETKLRDPRVMKVMLDAAREVVRHRGLQIKDPE
eukprot:3905083-Lingulodinium_polyedra.AAC.1